MGTADAILSAAKVRLELPDRPDYEHIQASLRGQSEQETVMAVWEEGRAMTLEQVGH